MCQHIKSFVINFIQSQVFQMDFLRTAPRDLSLNSVRHKLRQLMISPSSIFFLPFMHGIQGPDIFAYFCISTNPSLTSTTLVYFQY